MIFIWRKVDLYISPSIIQNYAKRNDSQRFLTMLFYRDFHIYLKCSPTGQYLFVSIVPICSIVQEVSSRNNICCFPSNCRCRMHTQPYSGRWVLRVAFWTGNNNIYPLICRCTIRNRSCIRCNLRNRCCFYLQPPRHCDQLVYLKRQKILSMSRRMFDGILYSLTVSIVDIIITYTCRCPPKSYDTVRACSFSRTNVSYRTYSPRRDFDDCSQRRKTSYFQNYRSIFQQEI